MRTNWRFWDIAIAVLATIVLVAEAVIEGGSPVAIALSAIIGGAARLQTDLPPHLVRGERRRRGGDGRLCVPGRHVPVRQPSTDLLGGCLCPAIAGGHRSGSQRCRSSRLLADRPAGPQPGHPSHRRCQLGAAWAGGAAEAARRRRSAARALEEEAAERRRQAEALAAADEERSRIVREVHDIVGHSVTVMLLHAGAAQRLMDTDLAAAATAVNTVEEVGREALAELDRVLGLQRREHRPSTAPLLGWTTSVNSPGASATPASRSRLEVEGEPQALPRSTDLAVYRIVQESLTNVARHAGGAPAEVRIGYAGNGLRVVVSDSGKNAGPANGGRGLAGIRERVEELGGELDSRAGSGGRLDGRRHHPPAGPMISVVVVDDDQLVRSGVRMILETAPDITVTAEGVRRRRSYPLVSKSRPDVVLMDVRMPGTDGIEATRRLATMAPECRIAILTTFEHDEYVFEALRAGASGFLLKRIPPDDLIAAVRTLASGDALLSPSVTRRLIEVFARRTTGEGPIRRVGTAHRAGAPSPGRAGDRCLERRASRGALHLRGDGADPREAGPLQTGSAGSSPGDRLRLRVRTGSPRSSSAAGLH